MQRNPTYQESAQPNLRIISRPKLEPGSKIAGSPPTVNPYIFLLYESFKLVGWIKRSESTENYYLSFFVVPAKAWGLVTRTY